MRGSIASVITEVIHECRFMAIRESRVINPYLAALFFALVSSRYE
jgi:hypothetical protein